LSGDRIDGAFESIGDSDAAPISPTIVFRAPAFYFDRGVFIGGGGFQICFKTGGKYDGFESRAGLTACLCGSIELAAGIVPATDQSGNPAIGS